MNAFYPPTPLVVVDPTVRDYHSLIDCISIDHEVLILDPEQDGVQQIADALGARSGLTSLHILSHGEPGGLKLGSTRLNLGNLKTYAAQIQQWSRSIAHQADILLYACQVAAGATGQAFVERLSQLTGATIAASARLVGSQALGGNWHLGFATGVIHTPSIFPLAAMKAYPHVLQDATVFLRETFTGEDVTPKNWIFGVDDPTNPNRLNPFLTARSTVAAPEGGLPGNPGTPPYPAIDQSGQGVLRLTNVLNDQAAYVLYNEPFSSNQGLIISFDFFMYGGSGADGISFFLADGSNPPTEAGAFGGSLGYAQRTTPTNVPGLQGGFLGIGFDAFGNYSNPTEGRVGGPGFTPDAIAIRGSAANNYEYLTGTSTLPFSLDAQGVTDREQAVRTVVIEITPSGLLSIKIDANQDGSFDGPGETPPELQNIQLENLPETLTFGFAASTGDQTNVHEIRNIVLQTFGDIPPIAGDITLTLQPGATVAVGELPVSDPDGTITSIVIATLPDPAEGQLFVGNPATNGRPVILGEQLTAAQGDQLFFVAGPGFTGGGFTYFATDNDGLLSNTASVGLVRPPNLPPFANDLNVNVAPGTTTAVGTIPIADPDGTISTIVIATLPPPEQGQLFVGDPAQGGRLVTLGEQLTPADANQLVFVPAAGFTGTNISYFGTDDLGVLSNVGNIGFLLLGDNLIPPVVDNLSVRIPTLEATPLGAIPATDADGFITSIVIATLPPPEQGQLFLGDPAQGGRPVTLGEQLSVAQANQLFFLPIAGFTGASFTFFATDDDGLLSNVGTVTLSDENLPPIANDLAVQVLPGVNTALGTIPASDPDGFITSIVIATLPPADQGQLFLGDPTQGGRPVTLGEQLSVSQANQLFFVPGPGFTGATFTYFATDDLGVLSNVATVTLSDTDNLPPIANSFTVPVTPGVNAPLGTIPASDPDGFITSIVIATLPPPEQGQLFVGDPEQGGRLVTLGEQLSVEEANQLIFVPGDGFAGSSFTYFATDNFGVLSNVATVGLGTEVDPDQPSVCPPGIFERGDDGNNELIGTAASDTLIGGRGNDTIRGLECDDVLRGGAGNDRIFGGPGNDLILGGLGNDRLNGGPGNDTINGGRGNDRIRGGPGNDVLAGGWGNDTIRGGLGNDLINGNRGNDRLFGGPGNDTINGGLGRDRINGGPGNDLIAGGRGDDTIRGGPGNDTIFGGRGNDLILGGANNDVLYGNQGNDTLRGVAGSNVLFGGLGNDVLIGGRGNDILYGGSGNDTLRGGPGDDVLYGIRGRNRLAGGPGNDTIVGGTGNDTITSGAGTDVLTGGGGSNRFVYRSFNHGGDVITDFNVDQDDLFLRPLFSGPRFSQRSNPFAYVRAVQAEANTIIQVDTNGNQADGFINFLTLLNVQADSIGANNLITA